MTDIGSYVHRTIDDTQARLKTEQDRLELTCNSGDATVHVKKLADAPLSADLAHLGIYISTDDGGATLELNGEQMDELVDAVAAIQAAYDDELDSLSDLEVTADE